MKLKNSWNDFYSQFIDLKNEGVEIQSNAKDVLTEYDYEEKKSIVSDWAQKVRDFLREAFVEGNQFAIAFYTAGENNFNIHGVQKDLRQLNKELSESLKHKINTLDHFNRLFKVLDVLVNPELSELIERSAYTTAQTVELLLDKLFLLYDDEYYPVTTILNGNGIELKRNTEVRELGMLLEQKGYADIQAKGYEIFAQLTLKGKIYVEERRKPFKENYDDIKASQEELNQRVDEIIEKLTSLGYGQEILFDEIQELREQYSKLSKKNWGQLVKGKLFDLAVDRILDKDTVMYIYDKLTSHVLHLP